MADGREPEQAAFAVDVANCEKPYSGATLAQAIAPVQGQGVDGIS